MDVRIGGRYRVLGRLGAGGMGAVHRVVDETSGRTLALKQMLSSLAGPQRREFEAMFEREYYTLVRLKHPRVIEVYDFGTCDTGPFYTMELLEGRDLQELAPLPVQKACSHLRDVASLIALLQAHRLVHRDLTPRNVKLTLGGRAKVIDFGALHPFGTPSSVIGTAAFIAPESLR